METSGNIVNGITVARRGSYLHLKFVFPQFTSSSDAEVINCYAHPRIVAFLTMQENARQSWILDFTSWNPDSRYCIRDSLFVEPGFLIPILSCTPVSKAQDPGFHSKSFLDFGNQISLQAATFHVQVSFSN